MSQIHGKIGTGEGLANCCLNIWMEAFFSERIKGTSLYLLLNLCLSLGVGLSNPICLPLFITLPSFFPLHLCSTRWQLFCFGVNIQVSLNKTKWMEDEWACHPSRSHQTHSATIFNQQAGRHKLAWPLFSPPCSSLPFLLPLYCHPSVFPEPLLCQAFRYSNWGKQE